MISALLMLMGFFTMGYMAKLLNDHKKSKKPLEQHFQEFLKAYAAWHASGAGKHKVFTRDRGLCTLWGQWSSSWVSEASLGSKERIRRMWETNRILIDKFKAEGRCPAYPFNDGFVARFKHEEMHSLMHTNKERILFVKRHIK